MSGAERRELAAADARAGAGAPEWPARLLRWWGARPAGLRWAAVAAAMGLLWWSSSRELTQRSTSWLRPLLHNGAHVIAYGGIATLAVLALAGVRTWRRRELVVAVLVAAAYGIVDEVHQSFVPGRAPSVADVATDVTGALLAVAVGLAVQWRPWLWRFAVPALAAAAAASVAIATWTDW